MKQCVYRAHMTNDPDTQSKRRPLPNADRCINQTFLRRTFLKPCPIIKGRYSNKNKLDFSANPLKAPLRAHLCTRTLIKGFLLVLVVQPEGP